MAKIVFDNVTIEYPVLGHNRNLRKALVGSMIGGNLRQHAAQGNIVITALDGVSFTLEHGSRVGLIGHNGAGKSTLLKTMAGIYPPIIGKIQTEGVICSLFNQPLGMDMDETGIENIKAIGLFLGMSQQEINEKMDDIISFSELDQYINLPVRTYSTGMVTRLTFTILTALRPDILLMDEGMGAGDTRFEQRARQRIDDMLASSGIVVFASHSEALLSEVCDTGMLFEGGRLIEHGPLASVFQNYYKRIA